jgi:hypothetical protein
MRVRDGLLPRLGTAGFQGLFDNKWQLEQIRGESYLLLLDDLIEKVVEKLVRVLVHTVTPQKCPFLSRTLSTDSRGVTALLSAGFPETNT